MTRSAGDAVIVDHLVQPTDRRSEDRRCRDASGRVYLFGLESLFCVCVCVSAGVGSHDVLRENVGLIITTTRAILG